MQRSTVKSKFQKKLSNAKEALQVSQYVTVIVVDVQMLEYEMATNADKLKSIVDQGKEMAAAGHFDSASILKAVQDFDRR